MEESQLIEGCVRGESAARKKLYELYAPTMMSVCLRYVGCRETARDLMHDGFVKLYTKIHTYSGAGSFNGWIRRVFVTTALDYLRRNEALRHRADIESLDYLEASQDTSAFERLSIQDLYDCIAKLPEIYKIVFNMHAIEGYSHVEIAKELEISDATSRSRYAKAREMLQKMVSLDDRY